MLRDGGRSAAGGRTPELTAARRELPQGQRSSCGGAVLDCLRRSRPHGEQWPRETMTTRENHDDIQEDRARMTARPKAKTRPRTSPPREGRRSLARRRRCPLTRLRARARTRALSPSGENESFVSRRRPPARSSENLCSAKRIGRRRRSVHA